MSDDELEKLAAEMQNIQPSADSRKQGMTAAMAAFDLEFASETAETTCLLYTSPSPRDRTRSRMPSSA